MDCGYIYIVAELDNFFKFLNLRNLILRNSPPNVKIGSPPNTIKNVINNKTYKHLQRLEEYPQHSKNLIIIKLKNI